MGAVYKAHDDLRGCQVAVKRSASSEHAGSREQFFREAKLLARLTHPALPKVHDYFTEGDEQYLVMEYIEGEDFAQLLQKSGKPFSLNLVLGWADQLLQTLDYIHNHHPPIIHRDIKPHNVKLKSDGTVTLLDFGLAKNGPSTTLPGGSFYGYSINYVSPEQRNAVGTDQRSDIYSLGATLYHLLTNRPPHDSLLREEMVKLKQPDPLPKLSDLDPYISGSSAAVIHRALELRPQDRWQSARAMRDALTNTVAVPQTPHLSISTARPRRVDRRVLLDLSPKNDRRNPKATNQKPPEKIVEAYSPPWPRRVGDNSLSEPFIELLTRIIHQITESVSHLINELMKAANAYLEYISTDPTGRRRFLKVVLFVTIPFFLAIIYMATLIYWR